MLSDALCTCCTGGDASIFPRPEGDVHPELKRRLEAVKCDQQNKRRRKSDSPNNTSESDNDSIVTHTESENSETNNAIKIHSNNESKNNEDFESSESQCRPQCNDNNRKTSMVMSDGDLYRTGAKCVDGMQQDTLEHG